jgi:hypothetical protein
VNTELLTPNERGRLGRLEAAQPKYRNVKWRQCRSLILKLETRATERELARMIEAETPTLVVTRPLVKKAEPFKRYAKRPFCG